MPMGLLQGPADLFRELYGISQRLGSNDKGDLWVKVRKVRGRCTFSNAGLEAPAACFDAKNGVVGVLKQLTAVRDTYGSIRYRFIGLLEFREKIEIDQQVNRDLERLRLAASFMRGDWLQGYKRLPLGYPFVIVSIFFIFFQLPPATSCYLLGHTEF